MDSKYFSVLLVVLSSLGALWIGITPVVSVYEIAPALLLVLLGCAVLASVNTMRMSGLMLLFFSSSLLFLIYVYFTTRVGILTASLIVVNLLGIILSMSATKRLAVVKKSVKKSAGKAAAKTAKAKAGKRRKRK